MKQNMVIVGGKLDMIMTHEKSDREVKSIV